MLWTLMTSFFLGSACAMHLEYLEVDSAEELLGGNLLILDTSQDSVHQDEDLPMPEAQLPGKCWACQWVMKKVKKDLGNNINEGRIKTQLGKVCNSIGFLRSVCKKMINMYMDTLVEELSTTDDPKTICVNIGVCKSADVLKLIEVFQQNNKNI